MVFLAESRIVTVVYPWMTLPLYHGQPGYCAPQHFELHQHGQY